MKKREFKVLIVILLLVFVLTLSGCQNIKNTGSNLAGKFGKGDKEFASKLIGVAIKPIPTTSKDNKIRSGESFGIITILTNNLEQAISGRVCLSDRVSDEFGGIPRDHCEQFDIEAANERGPKEATVFQNDVFTYSLPDDFGNVDIDEHLFYEASMAGKIKSVCIKPSILTKGTCQNEESFGSSSLDFSSGPLIVTAARKEFSQQQNEVVMRLFVTLRKLSNAEIINPSLVNTGGVEELINDNEVLINAEYVGLGELTCDKDNKVEIVKGSTEVECIGRFSVNEVVESPIAISLSYGVKQTINVGTFNLILEEDDGV
ncbi:MAG: hypothetical protein HYS32_01520 [Candidatus Woesearchaeota archaeon]|nr:MAG: hypothetical protein HYS32_01520 [Candidatus Woesearchaeota archaeon]